MKPAHTNIYCKFDPQHEVWHVWTQRADQVLGKISIGEFETKIEARNVAYSMFLAFDVANAPATYYYENLEPINTDAANLAEEYERWKK